MTFGETLAEAWGPLREDAIQTDAYLEMLLAGATAGAAPTGDLPTVEGTALIAPALVGAARALRDALVRIHPSFRFEERLAGRLRAAVDGVALPRAAGDPIPFRSRPTDAAPGPIPGDVVAVGRLSVLAPSLPEPLDRLPRPVLIGGAIASGVSLAGVALVAWRRRPGRH